jgi:hypothetical protein
MAVPISMAASEAVPRISISVSRSAASLSMSLCSG